VSDNDGAAGDAAPAATDGATAAFAAPPTEEQSPLEIPDTASVETSAASSQVSADTEIEAPADDETGQPTLSDQWGEASTPASRPASGLGEPANEPFMPPPPVEPVAEASTAAEPFAAAAMANGGLGGAPGAVEARRRGPSLFERVTGAGRARQARDAVTEAVSAAAAAITGPEAPTVAVAERTGAVAERAAPETTAVAVAERTGAVAERTGVVAERTAEITPEAAQPKLGELEAPEKGKGIDEDLLDIPAFLRRQAN
jgi:cell division protein FtsZ